MAIASTAGLDITPVCGVYAAGSQFSLARPVSAAPGRVRDDFAELLDELRHEGSTHSWASASPTGNDPVRALLERELEARPTTFYFYYGPQEELLAVGTVAHRLSRLTESPGIPVIARAYVRAKYRGAGVYGHMFRHRLSECLALHSALDGVHVGTASAAVRRRLETSALTFLQLGHQALDGVPGGVVGAYLWLHPRTCVELAETNRSTPASSTGDTLRSLAEGRCGSADRALLAGLSAQEASAWPDAAARRVLQFCAELELTETS